MSAHTPGPWAYQARLSGSENHKGFYIKCRRFPLADVIPVDSDGIEGEANARLIAAAPDLLTAAREAMSAIEDEHQIYGKDDDYTYDTLGSSMSAGYFSLKAAIAKATGAA